MEDKEYKTIYFIYAQEGKKNNIESIPSNDTFIEAQIISEDIYENEIQILYRLKISKKREEKGLLITLLDSSGKVYNSKISLNPLELFGEENNDINDYLIYNVKFQTSGEINCLNQKILSYIKQFNIFENKFKDDNKTLIYLYKSTIFQLLLKPNLKLDFILDFFLKMYNNQQKVPKDILICFLKNIKLILKNCNFTEPVEKPEQNLHVLNDIETIIMKLKEITNEENMEENIFIFLAYYYIHYEKKLFVRFISNNQYKDKINLALISNRELFNNFTCDVLSPDIIDEAESMFELLYLLKLYPNIVECFRIVSYKNIFLKFMCFKQFEKMGINLVLIQEPKKSDDINLLKQYFEKVNEYFMEEKIYPFILKEDFFLKYIKIFEENDEDFSKKIILIDMLNLYNKKFLQKIRSEIFMDSFFKKGIFLLKRKKLKNLFFINFFNIIPDTLKNDPELIRNFHNGIDFKDENDDELVHQILQEDKFNLIKYLGNSYEEIFEDIFDKFVLPRDLLILSAWKMNKYTPLPLIEIFLKTIKRIWLNFPENKMYGLEDLFAKEFALASLSVKDYLKYINDIEEEVINKIRIMEIYSDILIKEYDIKNEFKAHMKDYITSYNKITPRYIWCLITTYEYKFRTDILGKYLDSDGKNLAVKYSDFSNYPNKLEERLILFINLKNYGIIPTYFAHSDYYKDSMKSKNYIEHNIFKDCIVMSNNLDKIKELLEIFFLDKDEDPFTGCYLIMINFQDKFGNAKKYYDSLKLVQNYWTKFFSKEKKEELANLTKYLTEFENKKLVDCIKEIGLENPFLKYHDEAEEGNKLEKSIFFMEFYERLSDIDNEKKRFDLSLKNFNELKKLDINCNISNLEANIREDIINAASKNQDILHDELNYIKDYFKFGEKSNFDIKAIENDIINLVKKKQNK